MVQIMICRPLYNFWSQEYNEVKKKHGYPQYVEVLLEECEYFLCDKEPGGFLSFLGLVEEQRKHALQHIQNDVAVFNLYRSKLIRDDENDELKDLGTAQGLSRVMRWFGMTEEQRQSLKGGRAPPLMDDTVEIGDIYFDNVGNDDGPTKPLETRTR